MNVGEKRALPALFLDGKGLVPTTGVVWTSNADGVVGVNPTTGDAVATSKGTAVITVALQADPSVKAQITINVGNTGDVTSLEVTPAQTSVAIGESAPLLAKVTLGTGEVKSDVIWSSSDEKIATVDAKGTVTGKAVGTVQILASYAGNQSFKGQAAVRVTATKGTTATPTPAATSGPDGGPETVTLRKPGTWVDAYTGTGTYTYMKFFDANNGVAAGLNAFATSTDGGKTWTASTLAVTAKKFDAVSATDIWVVTDGAIASGPELTPVVDFKATYGENLADVTRTSATEAFAITTTGKLFKSTDAGKTWSSVAGPAASHLLVYNYQDNTVWGPVAATPGGGLHYGYYHSVSCKNFQTNSYYDCLDVKQYSNPDGSGWVNSVAQRQITSLEFTNAKEGWRVSTLGYFDRTVDGGRNWINAPLPGDGGIPAFTHFVNANEGVLATNKGYYTTENDGRSWKATLFDTNFNPSAMAVLDLDHMWVAAGGKIKRYVILAN
jgi:photosystem II stability/assembly factor-like uncharacterized protein